MANFEIKGKLKLGFFWEKFTKIIESEMKRMRVKKLTPQLAANTA